MSTFLLTAHFKLIRMYAGQDQSGSCVRQELFLRCSARGVADADVYLVFTPRPRYHH